MKPLNESKSCAAPFKGWPLLAVLVILFFSNPISGQEYRQAVGGRLAAGGLATYKFKLKESLYAEGLLSLRWKGVILTGLVEKQSHFFKSKHTYWVYGAGLHLGIHGRDNVLNPADSLNQRTYINMGIDLVGGIEYCFPAWPITIGVDYLPVIYFTGTRGLVGEGLGLSVRYILN